MREFPGHGHAHGHGHDLSAGRTTEARKSLHVVRENLDERVSRARARTRARARLSAGRTTEARKSLHVVRENLDERVFRARARTRARARLSFGYKFVGEKIPIFFHIKDPGCEAVYRNEGYACLSELPKLLKEAAREV